MHWRLWFGGGGDPGEGGGGGIVGLGMACVGRHGIEKDLSSLSPLPIPWAHSM